MSGTTGLCATTALARAEATGIFTACLQDARLLLWRGRLRASACASAPLTASALVRALDYVCDLHQQRAPKPTASLQRLLDWEVRAPCCNDNVQNTLKWSLMPHVHSPNVCDEPTRAMSQFGTPVSTGTKATPGCLGRLCRERRFSNGGVQEYRVFMGGAFHVRSSGTAQPQVESRQALGIRSAEGLADCHTIGRACSARSPVPTSALPIEQRTWQLGSSTPTTPYDEFRCACPHGHSSASPCAHGRAAVGCQTLGVQSRCSEHRRLTVLADLSFLRTTQAQTSRAEAEEAAVAGKLVVSNSVVTERP